MEAKNIAFIALMGALGNILFLFSYHAANIVQGVAVDLSHIPTFIAAIYGGPTVGLITGLLVGVLPGIYFGPLGSGSWLGLIGLPIGKALTGLTAGLLYKHLNVGGRSSRSLITIPLVLASYIPECLFTIFYFTVLLPVFIGKGGLGLLVVILPKAWAEIVFMGVFMGALVGNQGFNMFISSFLKGYGDRRSGAPR